MTGNIQRTTIIVLGFAALVLMCCVIGAANIYYVERRLGIYPSETYAPAECTGTLKETKNTGREILVIGDSIAEGWRPFVDRGLPTKNILYPRCNAKGTINTLRLVDVWLEQRPSFDAIIWNNGLWDVMQDLGYFVSPNDYRKNLTTIGRKIKAKTVHPLFLLMTDVPQNARGRTNSDVVAYNKIALDVMAQLGIPVLDLYSIAKASGDLHKATAAQDDVHFQDAGYERFGLAILEKLKTQHDIE